MANRGGGRRLRLLTTSINETYYRSLSTQTASTNTTTTVHSFFTHSRPLRLLSLNEAASETQKPRTLREGKSVCFIRSHVKSLVTTEWWRYGKKIRGLALFWTPALYPQPTTLCLVFKRGLTLLIFSNSVFTKLLMSVWIFSHPLPKMFPILCMNDGFSNGFPSDWNVYV